ncbi:MAG: aminotransferase class I/II-fold pyridoxal phosphate-dependent enzyme [Legionellaceae bacterium]|nr:aminotransferase class I/II-fold pyridoxal phosphate-dependent enzyme [Legionellaceae bacterium]
MLKLEITNYLEQKKQQGIQRMRQRLPLHLNQAKQHINFSSNDYLGLANNLEIKQAYQEAFYRYPVGSTGSALVSGYHITHEALEHTFSDALGVDACLLFPSGYAANLSLMNLLAELNIHPLIDKNIHASIYDGLRLGGHAYTRYRHQDLEHFKHQLNTLPEHAAVITESLFSMSGHMPHLKQIAELAHANNHPLFVDEAHAFGLYGPEGLGAVMQHGLTQTEVPLRVIPLGKAFGASGAIVAGDRIWVDALVQAARPLIYSTAMSPALAFGLLNTFSIIRGADAARKILQKRIYEFREHIKHSPLNWRDSHAPIQQLLFGCPKQALNYAEQLQAQGIICIPMREPTVKRSETGLRICLNVSHTSNNIHALFESLHQCHISI